MIPSQKPVPKPPSIAERMAPCQGVELRRARRAESPEIPKRWSRSRMASGRAIRLPVDREEEVRAWFLGYRSGGKGCRGRSGRQLDH